MPLVIGALLSGASFAPRLGAADGPYRYVHDIRVGGEATWGYMSVDSVAKRLYLAHASRIVVIDTVRDAVVGQIADTPGVRAMIAVRDLGRGFTGNGGENRASIIDLKTLQTIQKVDIGRDPGFLLYEPRRKEVYVFNLRSSDASVINAVVGKPSGAILLDGKPGAAVTDEEIGRVYVNLEDKNEIAVIDVYKRLVVDRWPIAPGAGGAGLAIDLRNHRLFVGAHNGLMLMLDSGNGHVVARVPIGSGVDSTWFDPGTGYAFSSCGDGTTTIAHEDSPEKLTLVQKLQTERGARTMALDPATHRIYLAAVRYAGATPVPDSMRVLVYEFVH